MHLGASTNSCSGWEFFGTALQARLSSFSSQVWFCRIKHEEAQTKSAGVRGQWRPPGALLCVLGHWLCLLQGANSGRSAQTGGECVKMAAADAETISLRPMSLRPGGGAVNPFAGFAKGAGAGLKKVGAGGGAGLHDRG